MVRLSTGRGVPNAGPSRGRSAPLPAALQLLRNAAWRDRLSVSLSQGLFVGFFCSSVFSIHVVSCRDADVLDCSLQLDTPLMLAANNGYLNVVRYLVEHTEAGEVFDDRAEEEKRRAEAEEAEAKAAAQDDEDDEKEAAEDDEEEDDEEDAEEAQRRRDEARAKRKQARADARKLEQQMIEQQQQLQPKFVLGLEQKVGHCCCRRCCRYHRCAHPRHPSRVHVAAGAIRPSQLEALCFGSV